MSNTDKASPPPKRRQRAPRDGQCGICGAGEVDHDLCATCYQRAPQYLNRFTSHVERDAGNWRNAKGRAAVYMTLARRAKYRTDDGAVRIDSYAHGAALRALMSLDRVTRTAK